VRTLEGKKWGVSAQSNRKRDTTLQFAISYDPLLSGLIKHNKIMQGNNFLKWDLLELVLLQNQFIFMPDVYSLNAERQI